MILKFLDSFLSEHFESYRPLSPASLFQLFVNLEAASTDVFSFELQVYIQDLSSSNPELKLPSTSSSPIIDPHISPDGTMIAFVRDRELHILNLLHNERRQLTDGAIENAMVSLTKHMDTGSFFCVFYMVIWAYFFFIKFFPTWFHIFHL